MSNLHIFNNQEFGKVRFLDINGKPYAVGVDVTRVLGYANPSKAVLDHCKGITKLGIPSLGGIQETNVIPEGDIYRLIIRSKLPTAERFESWVFDEVLPALRQKGNYNIQQSTLSLPQLPQTYQEALRQLADQVEENEKLMPKAQKYDQFMSSEGNQTIGQVAKVLNTGRTRLFKLLKSKGILMSDNTPYQKYINLGYFDAREASSISKGFVFNHCQTLVTPKGIDMIYGLLWEDKLNTIGDVKAFLEGKQAIH